MHWAESTETASFLGLVELDMESRLDKATYNGLAVQDDKDAGERIDGN